MILYHYTCMELWPKILKAGYLNVTESNFDMDRPHAGPDVVWLTTDKSPVQGWNAKQGVWVKELKVVVESERTDVLADKTKVRFTIDVPDAEVHHWPKWGKQKGMDRRIMALLAETGGNAQDWYVSTQVVHMENWLAVELTHSGRVLYRRSA